MNVSWPQTIKSLVPRAVRQWLRRQVHGATFSGDYPSWVAARDASGGYDDNVIFEKALAATRAVRDGRAVWERDTVLFYQKTFHQPLLDALRRAAKGNRDRLSVVDFGGALGSTWWQHREALADLAEVRWSVVEQPRFVAAGKNEFSVGPLRFYETLDLCCASERPEVALLSSVLPYLEEPHRLLQDVEKRGFRHVIIDRTGFVNRGRDRLTVQRVPPTIYSASYPCWFFDREKLLRPFHREWRIVSEWPAFDQADIAAEYRGFALEKTTR
jgi:putative methyltransferase (TIGR04325 family)